MEASDGRGRPQRRGEAEDALGVISVQANPLPLRLIERTVLDPDPVRHADHAEVVDLARTPHSCRVLPTQPRIQRGCLSQLCDAGGVSAGEGRGQVDEIGEGGADLVQVGWTDAAMLARASGMSRPAVATALMPSASPESPQCDARRVTTMRMSSGLSA